MEGKKTQAYRCFHRIIRVTESHKRLTSDFETRAVFDLLNETP